MPRSDVTIDLKGRDAQLQAKLKGAGATIRAFAQRAGASIQRLNRYFLMLAGVVGTVAVAASTKQTQAEKKLEAVLKATGGAAGYSADELKRMAANLQLVTNYGDETTISAMAVLASFKQIKGDIFREAIVSAQDMSSVMGQDLQQSVVQLGKALNDPIRGAAALRRIGVSLTDQQMEQITAFQKNNQLMKAQRIILAELKGEFGGVAKEMRDPLLQLKNDLGDMAEVIGTALQPKIRALGRYVRGISAALTEKDSKLRENLISLGRWALAISGIIIIVPRLLRLLSLLLTAVKAITGAQTVMLALSGPKGWAVLAAGAVVAVGAIAGLKIAWDRVAEAAKEAKAASEDAAKAAAKAAKPGAGRFAKFAGREAPEELVEARTAVDFARARLEDIEGRIWQRQKERAQVESERAPGHEKVAERLKKDIEELQTARSEAIRVAEAASSRQVGIEEKITGKQDERRRLEAGRMRKEEAFGKKMVADEDERIRRRKVAELEEALKAAEIEARLMPTPHIVPKERKGFRAAFESAEQMYQRIAGAAAGRTPEDRTAEAVEEMLALRKQREAELRKWREGVLVELRKLKAAEPLQAIVVGEEV